MQNLEEDLMPDTDTTNDSFSDEDKKPVSKEFQEHVVKYVKLDDVIRKKQSELSELKDQRRPSEEYILKYLDNIGENMIEISTGKLRKNKSETKKALSQDIIQKVLLESVKDEAQVEEILKKMEETRPLNTHVNLKRTGPQKNKGKNRAPRKKKA